MNAPARLRSFRRTVHSVTSRLTIAASLGLALLAAACSGDGPSAPRVGSLQVQIGGLPSGAGGNVTVTGASGFSRSLSSSEKLVGLEPGTYTVAATDVTSGGAVYAPTPATQAVTIVAGTTVSNAGIAYAISTGFLTVNVAGLPDGAASTITVTGPGGFSQTVTSTSTLAGLLPGTYVIAAASVSAVGHTWTAAAVSQEVSITAGTTPSPVSVQYAIATGAISIAFAGVPAGATAGGTLTGPAGFSRNVTQTEVITNLAPGNYTLSAATVTSGGELWGIPQALVLTVTASLTPVPATLAYALASGRIAISINGLPNGQTAAVTISGPGGFTKNLAASDTLRGLTPGAYTVAAANVVVGISTYAPTAASQSVTVAAAAVAPASVSYALASGSIAVAVIGLPQSLPAAITVAGPDNYTASIANTQTLTNLKPGTYTITATNASAGTHVYRPTPTSQTVTVAASAVAAPATVTYALNSGAMSLTINGLPGAAVANVTVSGPSGYQRSISASTVLVGLLPGTYTVAAAAVAFGGTGYNPSPSAQSIVVPISLTAVSATVTYTGGGSAGGSLTVTVTGLSGGVNGAVTVSGPAGFSQLLTQTTTLTALTAGSYTVSAANVLSGSTTYVPTPGSQVIAVSAVSGSAVTVTYTASSGGGLNLVVDGMYIVQSVQSFNDTVPLIAGRDGYLRVFVRATQANTAAPTVRVRFYQGASLQTTLTIPAPSASVPTAISEGVLGSSWNISVPASLIVAGMSMLADVDPGNTVTETAEGDNTFPSSGTARALSVRTVAPFAIRLVPVIQAVNGTSGNVTDANKAQFVNTLRKVYPLNVVDVDVRTTPFVTSALVLQNNDGNGAWGQILTEINALRTADGSARYYYGVVPTTYSSGVAGLGYVPGRSAIGWDKLPSGDGVLAHELGHNFGRFHAPACGPGGPDPNYPYAGGALGVYGFDVAAGSLKASSLTDLMGYCNNTWISDYTYLKVLEHRVTNNFVGSASAGYVAGSVRPSLLVWGRITRGRLILEPAYEIVTVPSLPSRRGANRIDVIGSLGRTIYSLSFDGERVADGSDPSEQHFAFAIPMDLLGGAPVEALRLQALGRQVENRAVRPNAPLLSTSDPANEPRAERLGTSGVRVTWNAPDVKGFLIRDARTGDVLSFARGSSAIVQTRSANLEVIASDGVRSEGRRVGIKR